MLFLKRPAEVITIYNEPESFVLIDQHPWMGREKLFVPAALVMLQNFSFMMRASSISGQLV